MSVFKKQGKEQIKFALTGKKDHLEVFIYNIM